MKIKRVAILGSTGSIGRQALEVIDSTPGLSVCALAAGGNWELLAEQARKFRPQVVAIADGRNHSELRSCLGSGVEVLTGPDAMTELVRRSRPDILLTALVGSAGLAPTLAGIECGADLAIANKETLVMAGAVVMPAARAAGVAVLPVDSEHSAIFQCLAAGKRSEVRRVIITASGGALRDWAADRAESATVAEALNHPTWQMGPKITVDSATLINKALEIVEAHWFFDLPADEIAVVLHEQSIVHSLVEYCDGSVIAQMGRPDMTGPIAYALCHPHRRARGGAPLDLAAVGTLTFRRVEGRFARAVELGFEAIRRGGTAGAVLNSANEAAVAAFLAGKIRFGRIVPLVEEILNRAPRGPRNVTLEALVEADAWARRCVSAAIDG
ncbi:MAG: 1-deoxy-D-xylulose-5-phosphate reductoisomerase [Planctomycetaceae bacterium]|nr:1-deoxy-D-xylulose-5-phosphate reductoisomerase [Planctomycetaceae bacterium]